MPACESNKTFKYMLDLIELTLKQLHIFDGDRLIKKVYALYNSKTDTYVMDENKRTRLYRSSAEMETDLKPYVNQLIKTMLDKLNQNDFSTVLYDHMDEYTINSLAVTRVGYAFQNSEKEQEKQFYLKNKTLFDIFDLITSHYDYVNLKSITEDGE